MLVGVDRLGRAGRNAPPIVVVSPAPNSTPNVADGNSTASKDRESITKVEDVGETRVESSKTSSLPVTTDSGDSKARELFENPRVDRVLVVTDLIGGVAEEAVGRLLKTTARSPSRSTFSRYVVNQGFMIDPDRPGKAVVFTVVMSEAERLEFQKKLTAAFPQGVEETAPLPDLGVKLASIGDVSLIRGTAVAELKAQRTLREEESIRALKGIGKPVEKSLVKDIPPNVADSDPLRYEGNRIPGHETEVVVVPRAVPTPEQLASGPHPSVRRPREGSEPSNTTKASTKSAPMRPSESLIVVWVTSTPKRGRIVH